MSEVQDAEKTDANYVKMLNYSENSSNNVHDWLDRMEIMLSAKYPGFTDFFKTEKFKDGPHEMPSDEELVKIISADLTGLKRKEFEKKNLYEIKQF